MKQQVEGSALPDAEDRLWLVQCKRERTITPSKIADYLAEIPSSSTDNLYGMIFVAACEFSKKTRDVFRDWCRSKGIREAHIWGKADLEDQIFQPKNDNLLFAYFGISLQIRKRTIKTALRARLATKRTCERLLTPNSLVLLRDPEESRYPSVSSEEQKERPILVRVREYLGTDATGGICLQVSRCFAYLADDGEGWDYFKDHNDDRSLDISENPWADPEKQGSFEIRNQILRFWDKQNSNKAWFIETLIIKYDDILAIDGKGDDIAKMPHIYTSIGVKCKGYSYIENIRSYDKQRLYFPDPNNRLKIFPSSIEELPATDELFEG